MKRTPKKPHDASTTARLTYTQRAALAALQKHGGEGVMTKTGTMLAAGAELGHGEDGEGSREEGWEVDFFQRSTWKALLNAGRIEKVAGNRYRILIEKEPT